MVDEQNVTGFVPLATEDILDFINDKHDEWTPDDFEAQALHLVVEARGVLNHETAMEKLAEAQVWATLAVRSR